MSHHDEWIVQAERDLDAARLLLSQTYFEWAAYAAQQAAEKAVKALRIALGADVKDIKSHEMSRLLGTISTLAPHPDPLLSRSAELDEHNQQSRYPGLRGTHHAAPCRTYSKSDAEDVIGIAEAVVAYAKRLLPHVTAMWAGAAPPVAVQPAP